MKGGTIGWRRRTGLVPALLAALLAALAGGDAQAQPVDTLKVTPADVLARFEAARALAVDPSGTLYVADAGADVIVRLAPGERVAERLGGPGSAEGRFDDPADVDPTNGLVLLVADAGNGRIQRFSKKFLHLETLPVGGDLDAPDRAASRPIYDAEGAGGEGFGTGRPVAVASAAPGEGFAIDAARNVVLHWMAGGGAPRVVGGFADGAGALREPTALALTGDGRLLVADQRRAAVLTYDPFGSFIGALVSNLDAPVQALATYRGRLWIVFPKRILVCDLRGRRLRTLRVVLDAPLVDAARHVDALYLLTSMHLYRVTGLRQ